MGEGNGGRGRRGAVITIKLTLQQKKIQCNSVTLI